LNVDGNWRATARQGRSGFAAKLARYVYLDPIEPKKNGRMHAKSLQERLQCGHNFK
jgi:hypothetical protein